jgi:F-type H+-transporting ATPase subunit epsilon
MGFMNTFKLTIRTPEATVLDASVESLVVPGPQGSFGVLAHHAPLVGAVAAGVLRVRPDAFTESCFAVGDGVIEVTPAQVVVLADAAIPAGTPEEAEEKLAHYLRIQSLPAPSQIAPA